MNASSQVSLWSSVLLVVATGCGPEAHPNGAAPPAATQAASACPKDGPDYVPTPQPSTKTAIPTPPKLDARPIKNGEDYSVWGAAYSLRSKAHRREVDGKPIAVVGYIVKTNLPEAPRCAIHKTGQADPEDCHAPVPAFWLGDTPQAPLSECIKVMGWASNYANLFDAIRVYDSKKPEEYNDVFWGIALPNPLPAAGAKVRVSGTFQETFLMASSGAEADAIMGILTYRSMEDLEPAPVLATLPGVTRKPRR